MPCTRLLALALALAMTAAIASGCGSSKAGSSTVADTSPASTSTTATSSQTVTAPVNALTRAQLVAAANRVCAHANALIAKPNGAGESSSNQDIARSAREVSGYDRAEAAGLRALVPPAELANDMKQIVTGFQTYATDVNTLGIDAAAGDNAASTRVLASGTKLHEEIAAIAKRDGLTACAKPTP